MKLCKTTRPTRDDYWFYCPGCDEIHNFTISPERGWKFDGNFETPTFNPSLLYIGKTPACHLFLHGGRIQYLNDCGHKLNGQTVDMVEIPAEYDWLWNPGTTI